MRTLLLLHLLVFTAFGVHSQDVNQRTSKVQTQSGASLEIEESLFISNEIPSDLPERESYDSDEVYKKVIQGYINTHSYLINEEKAVEMGYSFPSGEMPDELQKRSLNKRPGKRQVPISEEEIKLREEKQKKLNSQDNDKK